MIDFMIFMVIYVNIKMLNVEIKAKIRILLNCVSKSDRFFCRQEFFHKTACRLSSCSL